MNAGQLVDAYRSIMTEIRTRERSADAPQLAWRLYNGMVDRASDATVAVSDQGGVLSDAQLTTPECRDAMQIASAGDSTYEGVVQLAILGGGPAGLS